MTRIGVDAGGTFTDFVVLREDGSLEAFKLRSNPAAPDQVILEGLERVGAGVDVEVVHGSTVATNALLERKGARTAFITTQGFEDLLEIGRQNRARLYDLTPGPKRLLVPPELCFGVEERTLPGGLVETAPGKLAMQKLGKRLREEDVRAVAICFLHSYLRPDNEQLAAGWLQGLGFLSISHEVCPEFREYERASTTTLNAYVGPLMQEYLGRLGEALPGKLWVMQSNGGALAPDEAGRMAVRTLLSGPAGGVTGALETGRASGWSRVLGFDMGGTSTDVSLVDGAPRETTEAMVDGLPVKLPMLEIHTVGAGGGSIARIDSGGLLRVGPESAGARPGPACYGEGMAPTVTDAHVVLGRIAEDQLAGGSLRIQAERAANAIAPLAQALGRSLEAAAAGILEIANATMVRAIRVVSVERGYDPRDFALVAFGGCGGLHACDIADQLGMSAVLAPPLAGGLSALGMLLADRLRDAARGVLNDSDPEPAFLSIEARLQEWNPAARLERTADLRYRGQSYELNVPWAGAKAAREAFEALHRQTYGYAHTGREIEVVTARVRAREHVARPTCLQAATAGPTAASLRPIHWGGQWRPTPVLPRTRVPETPTNGPALICDYGSTAFVPPGWLYRIDAADCLVLQKAD
jgi:N-methylhydantoinase A